MAEETKINNNDAEDCPASDRDILENEIFKLGEGLIDILLADRSSGKNIIWATDSYVSKGAGFGVRDTMTVSTVTDANGLVIQPRVDKSAEEQRARSVDKAEVFTPSWICNKQNNLIDAAWFGNPNSPFNFELDTPQGNGLLWQTRRQKIRFSNKKGTSWQRYVKAPRMEITCGEGPYLVSRYDTVSGKLINDPYDRIGLLDRKLRVVSENCVTAQDWLTWADFALKSVYGYEYQGDSLLIARENILWSMKDWYLSRHFPEPLTIETYRSWAEIISWNIWQMDGLKYVVPYSCRDDVEEIPNLFGTPERRVLPCPGCEKNNPMKHNGVRCKIMDWETGKPVLFLPPFTFEPIKETC